MHPNPVALAASLAVLAACSSTYVPTPADDDAVYRAALDTIAEHGKAIVLVDSTSAARVNLRYLPFDTTLKIASRTINPFVVANAVPKPINPELRTRDTLFFVHQRQVDIGTNPDLVANRSLAVHWADFRRRFPTASGWYRVSAVGYSQDGSQALVYVERYCGGLCATDSFVLLRQTGRTWRISRILVQGVS
jgi:hypothetical protein